MPTCALQPSQCSQFEGSQPLSQHAMSEQHSQAASFGGGAPLVSHVNERSDAESQDSRAEHHDSAEGAERQESPTGDARDPILEHEELVDKLDKMLKMRGKTLHSDLLSLMSTWVAEVGGQDKNRKSQDQTVSTVEDFVRSTAVRSISDLMQVDAKERSFWPEDELDDKKAAVLALLHTVQAKSTAAGFSDAVESRRASPMIGAPKKLSTPAASPAKTQGEIVAETPDSSLNAGDGSGAEGKADAVTDNVMTCTEAGSAATALPPASAQGTVSPGHKRTREGVNGSGLAQDDGSLDEQVETHKKVAEKQFKHYHDLLAKRQRLMREVEGAKYLEKTKREIAKKLEKEKEVEAGRDEELRQANAELEAAQKKVWAAQQSKRKQASHALALEAEMKEVLREQNESNDRLKAHTNEFHELLRKNTPA